MTAMEYSQTGEAPGEKFVQHIEQPPLRILRGGGAILDHHAAPQTCDIAIGRDGTITGIAPRIEAPPSVHVANLRDWLVVPGLVDMHQHLDKTRTRDAVANPDGTLGGAVRAYNEFAKTRSVADIMRRAEETIEACIAHGTVAIRTHVNVGPEFGLRGLEALSALRATLADRIALQLVVLPPPDADMARHWIDEAVAFGVDAIGGTPAHAGDPKSFLSTVFDAAERHGLGVDLHLDEHLDAARHLYHDVIGLTRARSMQNRVVAGHCSSLGSLPKRQAQPVVEGFFEAGIGVVALPAANLHLLGRDADALSPRGLTRARDLCRAGVNVACASDNIQDPFVPTGSGDMLELARWTMLAGHFDAAEFAIVFDMITATPARMMGLPMSGLRVGAPAHFLITRATGVADLVASGPRERIVLFGGIPVAGALPNHPVETAAAGG